MKTSDAIDLLAAALAKAQGDIGKAKQSQEATIPTKTGGKYSYGYATLSDVWDACRKPLSDNELAIIQSAETVEGGVEITTLLAHSSGQWISSSLVFTLDGDSPQAIGSAITYGRRYGLAALVGIAPAEDDDGQAAERAVVPRRIQAISAVPIQRPPTSPLVQAALDQGATLEKPQAWKPICPDHNAPLSLYPHWNLGGGKTAPKWTHREASMPSGWCAWDESDLTRNLEAVLVEGRRQQPMDDDPPLEEEQ